MKVYSPIGGPIGPGIGPIGPPIIGGPPRPRKIRGPRPESKSKVVAV